MCFRPSTIDRSNLEMQCTVPLISGLKEMIYRQVWSQIMWLPAIFLDIGPVSRSRLTCRHLSKIIWNKWASMASSSPAPHVTPFGHVPFAPYACGKGTHYLLLAWVTRSDLLCLILAVKHQHWDKFRCKNTMAGFRKKQQRCLVMRLCTKIT